jgi:hypothetical protein
MTTDGLFSQLIVTVRQGLCGLHGHDALLHFDNGHVSLLCTSCGHQSPGWQFGGATQRRAAAPLATAKPASSRVVVMPLVNARKVA